jgi:hypothetical protein
MSSTGHLQVIARKGMVQGPQGNKGAEDWRSTGHLQVIARKGLVLTEKRKIERGVRKIVLVLADGDWKLIRRTVLAFKIARTEWASELNL